MVIFSWFLETRLGQILGVIALCGVAFLGLKAHDAHVYHSGYVVGGDKERQAWIAQREEDQARQLAKAAADQRRIDKIAADNQALEGQLSETQNALDEAIHADDHPTAIAIPKSLSEALDRIR